MRDGRIIETGTHTELMTFEGEYCKIFQDSGNGV
jgi:ABC-type multidrug transport system fused ATPase/permease subunit